MSKRDLRSASQEALFRAGSTTSEPPLAAAYRAAVMAVCGIHTRVGEWDHGRFERRQRILDANDIDYDDYAAAVVKTWWGWCQLQGMRTVSVPIFCGAKAFARHMKNDYVEIDSLSDDVHHDRMIEELQVALMYIGHYPFHSLEHIRELLQPFQKYPPDPEIVKEVIQLLRGAYGFDASSYRGMAEARDQRYGGKELSQQPAKIIVARDYPRIDNV